MPVVKKLSLEQIKQVSDNFWDDNFCNSTACPDENSCINCLMAEFERITDDK